MATRASVSGDDEPTAAVSKVPRGDWMDSTTTNVEVLSDCHVTRPRSSTRSSTARVETRACTKATNHVADDTEQEKAGVPVAAGAGGEV